MKNDLNEHDRGMKSPTNCGFILFEALIAMTIVVSSGIGLIDIHQRLQGRHTEIQASKVKLWATASAYEIQIKTSTKHQVGPTKQSSRQLSSSRQQP